MKDGTERTFDEVYAFVGPFMVFRTAMPNGLVNNVSIRVDEIEELDEVAYANQKIVDPRMALAS